MPNFTPCWDGNVPSNCTYTYDQDGEHFEVVVEPNGVIQVLKDDWISKYSLAIHGDVEVLDDDGTPRFIRLANMPQLFSWEPSGHAQVVSIFDANYIATGELLLHLPTYVSYWAWQSIWTGTPDIHEDKTSLIAEDESWQKASFKAAKKVMDLKDIVAPNPIALPMKIPIVDEWRRAHLDITVETIKANAYAWTAWVFDDLYPDPRTVGSNPDQRPRLRFPLHTEVVSRGFLIEEHRLHEHSDFYIESRINDYMNAWETQTENLIAQLQERAEYDLLSINHRPFQTPRRRPWSMNDYRRALIRDGLATYGSFTRLDCFTRAVREFNNLLNTFAEGKFSFLKWKNPYDYAAMLINLRLERFLAYPISAPIRNPSSAFPV